MQIVKGLLDKIDKALSVLVKKINPLIDAAADVPFITVPAMLLGLFMLTALLIGPKPGPPSIVIYPDEAIVCVRLDDGRLSCKRELRKDMGLE